MLTPSIPENELARLSNLRDLGILDTPAEFDYDQVSQLVAEIFDVPIALVSLVDKNRQWFKSCVGLPKGVTETSREISFCGHAINTPEEVFVVNDATKDERFFDNPLVTGDLNLVFYAGAPLISSEGHALGTLCIIDTKSRKFESDQQRQLQIFARQISNIIETGYVSDESRVETNRKIEVYFEKCFSNSPASVYIVDKDGYVKAASDAYLEFVGLSNTEIIGKAAVQFLAPESRAEFTDKWLPLLKKNGKFTGFRCQWLRKKREAFGVLMSATAELDEDGEIIQSMVVVADISFETYALKELNLRNDFIQNILLSSGQLFYLSSIDRKNNNHYAMEFMGPNVEQILGFTELEYRQNSSCFSDNVYPEDLKKIVAAKRRVLDKQSSVNLIYRYKKKGSRKYAWIEENLNPVIEGDFVKIFGVARVVSEEVESKINLADAYEELKLMDQLNVVALKSKRHEEDIAHVMDFIGNFDFISGGRFYIYRKEENTFQISYQYLKNNFIDKILKKFGVAVRKHGDVIISNPWFENLRRIKEINVINDKKEIQQFAKSISGINAVLVSSILDFVGVKSVMLIPIVNDGELYGVIVQVSKQHLNKNQIQKVERFSHVAANVIAKSIAEDEKRSQRKLLERILNELPADVVVFDEERRYKYINNKAVKDEKLRKWLFGKTELDYIENTKSKYAERVRERQKYFDEAIETGKEQEWIDDYVSDEKELYMLRKIFPVFDGDKLEFILGWGVDITAQVIGEREKELFTHELEEKVRERTFELTAFQKYLKTSLKKEKEAGELKTKFVETASHQFRTPMAIISSNAELIELIASKSDTFVRNKLALAIKRIKGEVERMTNLLDDILVLGKVTALSELNIQNTNFVELCEDQVDRYNILQPSDRKIKFNVKGKSRNVEIDQKLISHALSNLISNAVKYSNDKPPVVSMEFTEDKIFVEVRDFGVGIPPEDIERVFQPFYRSLNVEGIKGTGLGLSICKENIEASGGKLDVESLLGEGSTFTIVLFK